MENLLAYIPLLPLLGFLFCGLGNNRLPQRVVSIVAPAMVLLSFIIALFCFVAMLSAEDARLSQTLYVWVAVDWFEVPIAFTFDRLSGLYTLMVTGIGFLIHVYSTGYMKHEEGYNRYFASLNLFIFFMLLLVLGDNMLLLFIGWEGVGLCSYLLIGHYFSRPAAAKAAKKAFVVNRIGDFGFLAATLMLAYTFGTLNFEDINNNVGYYLDYNSDYLTIVTLFLLLGAAGKSAQIPLYVWLPDAMEGPTPVSALIHAATMVTAGLYLVARLNPLFIQAPTTMAVMVVIGAATALLTAAIGMAQYDIKRVLAYSTVSQLGYMFMAMGVGAFASGIFHVVTHAAFKALLFLGSGSVIYAMHHEQDMRKMGGLSKKMPITSLTFLIGALAISGFPLLFAGFYSKDEILWNVFTSSLGSPLLWGVGALVSGMTAFYMFRATTMTFYSPQRFEDKLKVVESPWSMTMPLIILAILAIITGWLGIPHAFVVFPHVLENYFEGFFAAPPASLMHHGIELELTLMAIVTTLALFCMGIGWWLYSGKNNLPEVLRQRFAPLHKLMHNKFYVDELYQYLVIAPMVKGSRQILWRIVDVLIIDGLVNQVAFALRRVGNGLGYLHNGRVRSYLLGIVAGVCLVWLVVLVV